MFRAKNTGPNAGTPYDDPGYVASRYRDATKLGARTALHGRFGRNRCPWQRWVFDRFDPPAGARILEVGCGPGNLWAGNLVFVTEVRPLLDYLSSGTAAHAAGGHGRVAALSGALERELASRGDIRITKDTGMFVALW